MKAIGKIGEVIVKVGLVCMGVTIVNAAYNSGKRDAYRECHEMARDAINNIKVR